MAFKTIAEYQAMRRKDPQKAEELLKEAAKKGQDPVNAKNPGYSSKSLTRRMQSRGFGAPTPPTPAQRKRKRAGIAQRSKPTPRIPGNYPTTR